MKSSKQQIVLDEAKKAFSRGETEEALRLLDQISDKTNPELLFLMGEIYYKLQRWGDALNCFLLYRENCPENGEAKTYIDMINNILAFYHTDLYNP